jgi:hypothetical protein
MSENRWHHYCIYENPKDYPGKFVVRRWAIVENTPYPVADKDPIAIVGSLKEARQYIPPGLVLIPHQQGREDPVIVETWI